MGFLVAGSAAALASLLAALRLAAGVRRLPVQDREVERVRVEIARGAAAFLRQETLAVGLFVLATAGLLFALGGRAPAGLGSAAAGTFLLGSVASLLSGWIGMGVAVAANGRAALAARSGVAAALRVAHGAGSAIGLAVVGLALLGLVLALALVDPGLSGRSGALGGLALGASSVALFARVGGGIFTKAADVGADMAGKLEAGIPEDDPRNPAAVVDNVGDDVGDVAGMGADLFESYVGSLVAAVALAGASGAGARGAGAALAVAAAGALASILAPLAVRLSRPRDGRGAASALRRALLTSALAFLGQLALLREAGVVGGAWSAACALGLAAGLAIGWLSDYFTAPGRPAVRETTRSAAAGAATFVLSGFSWGMLGAALPVLVVAFAALLAYALDGLFGVALAAVGMLALTGAVMAVDAYGPVADNAGGIAQLARLPRGVREVTDELDALGNSTAAVGKGLAIGSAALTALALFSAYVSAARLAALSLLDAPTLAGLFLGAALPFAFAAWTIRAVSRAAAEMTEEVRRQFREIPGLLTGEARPEPARCVAISTRAALREMVPPGLAALALPVACGLALGAEALGGMLAGALASGLVLAIALANSGAAWDNAKKAIEAGALGGPGSAAHEAALVGDTVGDPFKDAAGPSLNILIKLMTVVALLVAPWLAR
ncbi:MAG: sodium-translocating pyrophosphatase [Clostridia bacterium]|nr:sodium-translocating pyrophosphatase [Clostridia bacterium]